jgi:hypothetical protein
MAKKKSKPAKPPTKSGHSARASLPDRRAMESATRRVVAELHGGGDRDSRLAEAQDLMYQAFDQDNEQRRVQFAKKALAISADCADAYVLLAEYASSRKEALDLFERGVAAGERALGQRAFNEDVGHFWGLLETRPYMRARQGLAHSLWTAGRRDEAVQHLQDMLRLNPNDNQGIRYTLASFLLFLDRDDDLVKLLQQYPDEGSATWAYTAALLAFRHQGGAPETRQLLKTAKKVNKHVVPYLLGEKYLPPEQPPYYSPGDESEAVVYIDGFLASWKSTAGAIAWLRASTPTKKPQPDKPPQGPAGFAKKALERIPQDFDVWQADCRQLPNWLVIDNKKVRPWTILVTSRSNDLVLASALTEEPPSAALIWDTLAQAVRSPTAGKPHRPTELQVRPIERWQSLRQHIEDIGVVMTPTEELDHLDFVLQGLAEHLGGKPQPGLLDVPGVKPEQVASFYEAAAYFFQQAPWKKVGFESAIKIECDKYQSGPWYAILMGQSGLTTGLALYDDIASLRTLLTGNFSDEESGRKTVATSVTFGEESDIPVADLEAAKQYGWKVARPDAYPSIFRKEPGLAIRPPLAWELELMEGCLRAVPDFVKRRKQDDPTAEEVSVTDTQLLRLCWVMDDKN